MNNHMRLAIFMELQVLGDCRVVVHILARGSGGPAFTPCIPIILSSPKLAKWRSLLN